MTTKDVTAENQMIRKLLCGTWLRPKGIWNWIAELCNLGTQQCARSRAICSDRRTVPWRSLASTGKYADAIEPLNRAAQMFPAPFNQRALLALSNCYRQDGQTQLADETAAAVEMPPDVPVGTKLVIAPIFHIAKNAGRRISEGEN